MIYKRAQHSSFRMNIYKATDNIGPGHKAGTRQVQLSKKMKATVQESISNTRVTWHLFHIERVLVSKMPLFFFYQQETFKQN